MNPWRCEASTDTDGAKVLDVAIVGAIDPGWFDDDGVKVSQIAADLAAHKDAKRITTRINSLGGSLFGGIAIYNLLRGHGAEVTSIVEGIAASAASIIAMAGKTVMARGSMLMIHNPSTIALGDAREMRRVAADLDKARESLVAIYRDKTGKQGADLRALLDAETWMTAEQAKRQGFADEIAGNEPAVEDRGATVILNSIAFPRAALPAAFAPEQEPAPMTVDDLRTKHPTVYAAIVDEGKRAAAEEHKTAIERTRTEAHADGAAEGVKNERARLQAIDDLDITGHAALVNKAKYGPEPMTAEALAVAAIKADKAAGADMLARRRTESATAAAVRPSSPEQTDAAAAEQERRRVIKAGAEAIDRYRGAR